MLDTANGRKNLQIVQTGIGKRVMKKKNGFERADNLVWKSGLS